MVSSLLRLLLLRILPGRLVPVLTAVELARLVQRWRRSRQPVPKGPRGTRSSSAITPAADPSRRPRTSVPPRSRS